MARYTVQCDECNTEHNGRAFDIDSIVKTCEWCRSDLCPNCEQKDGMHTHCAESAKEDDNE